MRGSRTNDVMSLLLIIIINNIVMCARALAAGALVLHAVALWSSFSWH